MDYNQISQSLNDTRKQVALMVGCLFLFGGTPIVSLNQRGKPDFICTFATALQKANYIFGWGVCVVIHLHPFLMRLKRAKSGG